MCYVCGSRGALYAHCLCASHAVQELCNCLRWSSGRCADMKAPSSRDLQPAGPFPNCAGMDAIFVLCISPPPQLFLPLRSFSFPPLLWVRSLAFSLISELILLLFIAGNQHLSHTATQPLPLLQCLQGRTALIFIKRSAVPIKHRRLVQPEMLNLGSVYIWYTPSRVIRSQLTEHRMCFTRSGSLKLHIQMAFLDLNFF